MYAYWSGRDVFFPNTQASSEQQLDCALDLMRRLPPQQIEKNLSDLIDLVSSHISSQWFLYDGIVLPPIDAPQ